MQFSWNSNWFSLMGTHQGPVLRCTVPECNTTWNLSDNVGLGYVNDLAGLHIATMHPDKTEPDEESGEGE